MKVWGNHVKDASLLFSPDFAILKQKILYEQGVICTRTAEIFAGVQGGR